MVPSAVRTVLGVGPGMRVGTLALDRWQDGRRLFSGLQAGDSQKYWQESDHRVASSVERRRCGSVKG